MADADRKEEEKDAVDQRKVLYIEFKWNNSKMKEMKDLDTMHTLYLLHLSLEKMREQTDKRNKEFARYNRDDRILQHPDYIDIMTRFINWHLDTQKKLDGAYLLNTPRIEVTNLLKAVGGLKEGWTVKLYRYLTKEVELSGKRGTFKIANYKHTSLGKTLASLTVDDMAKLLTSYVFEECKAQAKDNQWKGDKHRDAIVAWFRKENMSGAALLKLGKTPFKKKLTVELKDKKFNGPAIKMYGVITKCNVNEIEELK